MQDRRTGQPDTLVSWTGMALARSEVALLGPEAEELG